MRQFALRMSFVLMVVLIPVHIFKLDRLEAHVVAKAADNNDPAFGCCNAVKQKLTKQEMPRNDWCQACFGVLQYAANVII